MAEDLMPLSDETIKELNSPNAALIAEVWGIDEASKRGINKAGAIARVKHGILSQVPMICRGDGCPYVQTCYIKPEDRPQHGRCPIEIATIIVLFDKYCQHLEITEDDIVDLTLIKELIDLDIQLMRADHYMAARPEFIEEVPAFVTEDGIEFTKPEISRAVEYKEKLRKERHRILQLLNSTRKDKNSSVRGKDPSSIAADVIARAKELGLFNIIEVQSQ